MHVTVRLYICRLLIAASGNVDGIGSTITLLASGLSGLGLLVMSSPRVPTPASALSRIETGVGCAPFTGKHGYSRYQPLKALTL